MLAPLSLRDELCYRSAPNSASGSSRGSPSGSQCSSDGVSLSERTDAVYKGLCLLLIQHKASLEIRGQLCEQLHALLDNASDESVWLARVKYVYTYPLAKYLRNPLPPSPDVAFKPSGGLRGWMKSRLNPDVENTNVHLWYSWFQCKRSTLPLSDDVVEKNYDKHLLTLTKLDKGDDQVIHDIFRDRTFVKVLWELRSAVTDAFSASAPLEEWMPSANACFENTRGGGGQQAELSGMVGLFSLSKEGKKSIYESSYPLSGTDFHSIIYRPWVFTRDGIKINFHQERRYPYGVDEWSQLNQLAKDLDLSKPLNCTIQAVLEPNKVRIISKGNALPYYSCRPLQRAIHGSMRDLAPFRLIGRPFCPTDLIGLSEKASKTDQWFSVDYSAATDGLSWKYSGKILRFLLQDLPQYYQDLAMQVLGPHALHYPVAGGRGAIELRGMQQNGQLMGSILSFPILCLANFGVYCLATRDIHRDWTIEERLNHVLINGDDMVYAAPPSSWDGLVRIAASVGLEMSVGKAYVHRSYANINSVSVILPLHKEGPHRSPVKVNYLNTGLFFGQHKIQGGTDHGKSQAHMGQDPSQGLVVNLNTILAGSRPGMEGELLKMFLSYHSQEISREIRSRTYSGSWHNRNLFIPLELGGMGVTAPFGWKFKVTKQDLYVASGMINRYKDCSYDTQRPLRGYEIGSLDKDVNVPWFRSVLDTAKRFPLHRITFPRLRAIVRIGMIRWDSCKSALLA